MEVAYEGRKSDGKKKPRPCATLAKQYTRKRGLKAKDQSVLVTALACEGGSLLLISGIRGPVVTTMAMAMARSVVLWPYLFSNASMMRGMAIPEAPAALVMTPKAMPRRTIHHSFTMLRMGKKKIT